jgi:hypothetical protein
MVQRKKQRHVQKATLLAVGEGPADKAFLNHLKELYSHNTGQKVTVEAEDGGSPDVMVYNVIKKHQHQAFDRKILLLDEDVPVSDSAISRAQKGKLELIFSTPVCLEGMLLDVLGQHFPPGNAKLPYIRSYQDLSPEKNLIRNYFLSRSLIKAESCRLSD